MEEDVDRLRAALEEITTQNATLRAAYAKLSERTAALQMGLWEMTLDLEAQAETLVTLAGQSREASTALARAVGNTVPVVVSDSETAVLAARQTFEAAIGIKAYMAYMKSMKIPGLRDLPESP
ncbi:MAG TPA: hypothetical protein VGN52_22965 [Burkholderiales bacterium]